MAAGKWKLYNLAKVRLGDLTLDLTDTTNWKVALFTSTSNCNDLGVGTAVYGDLTDEVANAHGYTTGGVTLTGGSWAEIGLTDTILFHAGTVAWTASGGSIGARYAVIYKDATVNSIVKPLLVECILDASPADVTTLSGDTLTLITGSSGIFDLSGANID